MLPPGWWRVPLDERRGQSVKALLDRQLASVPRDRVGTLRYDQLLARNDPLARTSRYNFDSAGNLVAITDRWAG